MLTNIFIGMFEKHRWVEQEARDKVLIPIEATDDLRFSQYRYYLTINTE